MSLPIRKEETSLDWIRAPILLSFNLKYLLNGSVSKVTSLVRTSSYEFVGAGHIQHDRR